MEFFSSLAKTEQKTFSNMTMEYAGPSKEHMHIGCLAGALWRCAEADKDAVLDDDPEGEEYRQKENFFFTHNGVTWPLRATLQNVGGFVDVPRFAGEEAEEVEEVPRFAIQTEVRCKMGWGAVNWKLGPRIFMEEYDNPDRAWWVAAEELLPILKTMIKCAGCKCDIVERVKVVKPDGTHFLSQHCDMCTTRQWDEPCTKCGHYIGERGPESRNENGGVKKYNTFCVRCE